MAVLFGEQREDGKIIVGSIQYQIDEHPNGYTVEKIPDYPEVQVGIDDIMLYDPKSKEFSFEQKERPLTREEKQDQVYGEIVSELKAIKELLQK